jgi:AcrR family transcriptional regulator
VFARPLGAGVTKPTVVRTDPPRTDAVEEISTQSDRRAQRRASRQAQTQQNRIDILDAAEKIFGERGMHNGSLREIADEAGFSAAAIYIFFENKQHLLSETLTRRGDELLPVIRAVAVSDLTPLEKLHVLVDDTVTFFHERPYFQLLMRHVRGDATLTGPVLATFADRVNLRFEEALALIASIIDEGQGRRQIREGDARALAHLYSVLVNEFVLLHSNQDESDNGTLTSAQFHDVIDGALRSARVTE